MLKLILRKGLLHEKCEYWLRLNILIDTKQFKQAENKRLDLAQQKLLGPEFTKGCHPNAIYTSRPLRSLISKSSSINSTSSVIFEKVYNLTLGLFFNNKDNK